MLAMNGHVSQWSLSQSVSRYRKANGAAARTDVTGVQAQIISRENMTFKEIVNINRTKTPVSSTEQSRALSNSDAMFSQQFLKENVSREDFGLDNDKSHVFGDSCNSNSRNSDSSVDGLNICFYKLK